ncbi:MAG: TraR/DksA C4-type zinc finger protein [Candidatus Azambacteria bacterium]|nr:TraR/DksA C4-type zinc finger protein [Candidatus Azambacteria bacterium]
MEEEENRLAQRQKEVIKALLLSQQTALNLLVASRARKFKFLFEYADSVFIDYVEEFISTHVIAQLRNVKEALERIDSENFGICEACYKLVPFERLMAMPTATRCVQCAAENDRRTHRRNVSKSLRPPIISLSF